MLEEYRELRGEGFYMVRYQVRFHDERIYAFTA